MSSLESPLAQELRERIAAEGSISFRDFMAAALYHPRYGYYSRLRSFGEQGDFVTSPEVLPVFGALLARQVAEVWERLGRPNPFLVLELGAGSGQLAHDLLEAAQAERPDLADYLRYFIAEPSEGLRALQLRTLSDTHVSWERPPAPVHMLLANEVLDAFPVYRVRVANGTLRELRVTVGEGEIGWLESESAPSEVTAYFAKLGVMPPEGAVAEVNLDLEGWARETYARVGQGAVIVMDYGFTADELFNRTQGTLLTYYRHTMGSDPLVRVGEQDISTHVDFTTTATAAHRVGFDVLGLTTQRAMLRNLGLAGYQAELGDPENRARIDQLVDPRGLGAVKALFLAKDMPGYLPSGLRREAPWPLPAWVPRVAQPAPPEEFMDMWREAFGDQD